MSTAEEQSYRFVRLNINNNGLRWIRSLQSLNDTYRIIPIGPREFNGSPYSGKILQAPCTAMDKRKSNKISQVFTQNKYCLYRSVQCGRRKRRITPISARKFKIQICSFKLHELLEDGWGKWLGNVHSKAQHTFRRRFCTYVFLLFHWQLYRWKLIDVNN